MTQANVCPSCGAPLDNITGNLCPSCGSALPARGSSSPTIISSKSAFNSSAEAMDEVKRLIKEGDSSNATLLVSSEFAQSKEAAQAMVEQTGMDMQHARNNTPPEQPASSPISGQVIDAPGYEEPQKPSNTRMWIIGGSIGAVIFLCLCCCLPLIIAAYTISKGK